MEMFTCLKKQKKRGQKNFFHFIFFCDEAKRCLNKGCDFRSTVVTDIMIHMEKCPFPIDHILFNKLYPSFIRWEAAKSKSDSAAFS